MSNAEIMGESGRLTPLDLYQRKLADRREQLSVACSGLSGEGRVADLEIGCGHGHFLTTYAASQPERFCLGIDISNDRIKRAERKRSRARIMNLLFLQSDAQNFFHCVPAQIRFSRVFILFPDPWPKRKHHKNRLIQEKFLRDLARLSSNGAVLYLRTDHREYWQEMERVLERSFFWEKDHSVCWPEVRETVFQSRAEHYFSLAGVRSEESPGQQEV